MQEVLLGFSKRSRNRVWTAKMKIESNKPRETEWTRYFAITYFISLFGLSTMLFFAVAVIVNSQFGGKLRAKHQKLPFLVFKFSLTFILVATFERRSTIQWNFDMMLVNGSLYTIISYSSFPNARVYNAPSNTIMPILYIKIPLGFIFSSADSRKKWNPKSHICKRPNDILLIHPFFLRII